jgi:hypothetical protein
VKHTIYTAMLPTAQSVVDVLFLHGHEHENTECTSLFRCLLRCSSRGGCSVLSTIGRPMCHERMVAPSLLGLC